MLCRGCLSDRSCQKNAHWRENGPGKRNVCVLAGRREGKGLTNQRSGQSRIVPKIAWQTVTATSSSPQGRWLDELTLTHARKNPGAGGRISQSRAVTLCLSLSSLARSSRVFRSSFAFVLFVPRGCAGEEVVSSYKIATGGPLVPRCCPSSFCRPRKLSAAWLENKAYLGLRFPSRCFEAETPTNINRKYI